jgi:lysosomal acid lipase/cholesteryl ester hydrolase
VLAGPELGSPAFRLAERGYDVWLGNFRGNHYSRCRDALEPRCPPREHRTLDPDRDNEYWQFSWDEMAMLDLPAQLGLVLESTASEKVTTSYRPTGHPQIYYIGHSMGTTTYMALNSVDPSWGDWVELAVLLAPAAYMDHMESPITLIAPFADMVQWIADHMGVGEFLPSNWFMDWLADFVCPPSSMFEIVCENIVFLLAGYDE